MRVCPRCTELYPDDAGFCPMDGASLLRVTDPLIGSTIAQRYRVISRLGGGGMSSVYLARHVMIDRLSAMKVLRADLASSPEQRDRFLREARAVNRINHDNIVEITDFGEWDGLVYLVMEYVPSEPLSRALAMGPLPWQRVASIGGQVSSALGRAHQMGVVHRDLKPANVLLVPGKMQETAMLTDFGIAKILDAPTLTVTAQLFGTPGYIAPEYIEGAAVDARADLYSLGVLLYECLTGKMPYDEKSTVPLMLQVVRDPPRPVDEHGVMMPPGLARLVMRLLSRKPNLRARDAFQVQDELEHLLTGEGVLSVGPGRSTRRMTLPTMHEEEEESSRPFAHLLPLCEGGLTRVGDAAARVRGDDVAYLVERAQSFVRDLGVATRSVASEQQRISELERYARTLRGGLGHAIDELSRERSRLQSRIDDASVRRGDLSRIVSSASGDRGELASLIEEEITLQALADELGSELKALREHLRRRDESLDLRLVDARASLEGRVAALRSVGAEAWSAVDEAGRRVGVQAMPPDTMPRAPHHSMRRDGNS